MGLNLKIAILTVAIAVAACGEIGSTFASSVDEQVICLIGANWIEKIDNAKAEFHSDTFMLAQD